MSATRPGHRGEPVAVSNGPDGTCDIMRRICPWTFPLFSSVPPPASPSG